MRMHRRSQKTENDRYSGMKEVEVCVSAPKVSTFLLLLFSYFSSDTERILLRYFIPITQYTNTVLCSANGLDLRIRIVRIINQDVTVDVLYGRVYKGIEKMQVMINIHGKNEEL